MSTKIAIQSTSDSAWASTTDLMSGLMIIFLFISIVYMQNVSKIADDWVKRKDEIYKALQDEFKHDLKKWNAEIIKDSLTIRFNEPRVLFEVGKSTVKPLFREILDDFFPRYIHLLNQRFLKDISEIRIEGHTSSEWDSVTSERESYTENMILSHSRSREVLVHCMSLESISQQYEWAKSIIVASGMSSSKLIVKNGIENKEQSRRVEFRVRTNAEEKLTVIARDITPQ